MHDQTPINDAAKVSSPCLPGEIPPFPRAGTAALSRRCSCCLLEKSPWRHQPWPSVWAALICALCTHFCELVPLQWPRGARGTGGMKGKNSRFGGLVHPSTPSLRGTELKLLGCSASFLGGCPLPLHLPIPPWSYQSTQTLGDLSETLVQTAWENF